MRGIRGANDRQIINNMTGGKLSVIAEVRKARVEWVKEIEMLVESNEMEAIKNRESKTTG